MFTINFVPIAVSGGGERGNFPPNSQNLGKIIIFQAAILKIWAKSEIFRQRQ